MPCVAHVLAKVSPTLETSVLDYILSFTWLLELARGAESADSFQTTPLLL